MNVQKWVGTLDSRKAVALAIAFLLMVLNKVLKWDVPLGEMMILVAPLFAWAGIEGVLDVFKIRNGSENGVGKSLEGIFKQFLPFILQARPPANADGVVTDRMPSFSEAFDLGKMGDEQLTAAQIELMNELSRIEEEIVRRGGKPPEEGEP